MTTSCSATSTHLAAPPKQGPSGQKAKSVPSTAQPWLGMVLLWYQLQGTQSHRKWPRHLPHSWTTAYSSCVREKLQG